MFDHSLQEPNADDPPTNGPLETTNSDNMVLEEGQKNKWDVRRKLDRMYQSHIEKKKGIDQGSIIEKQIKRHELESYIKEQYEGMMRGVDRMST